MVVDNNLILSDGSCAEFKNNNIIIEGNYLIIDDIYKIIQQYNLLKSNENYGKLAKKRTNEFSKIERFDSERFNTFMNNSRFKVFHFESMRGKTLNFINWIIKNYNTKDSIVYADSKAFKNILVNRGFKGQIKIIGED